MFTLVEQSAVVDIRQGDVALKSKTHARESIRQVQRQKETKKSKLVLAANPHHFYYNCSVKKTEKKL